VNTKSKLTRQLEGLLQPGHDVRELFSELLISLAYARSGASVSMADLSKNENETKRNYEFLVEKNGFVLEVEVKTLSSIPAHPYDTHPLNEVGRSIRKLVEENQSKFANCLIYLSLSDRQPSPISNVVLSLEHCFNNMNEEEITFSNGKVKVSFKRFAYEDFDRAFFKARETGNFRFYLRPHHELCTWVLIHFEKPWKIDHNIRNALKDGFEKFSRRNASVVWLRFSDMIPLEFRPDDPVRGDAILDLHSVRQVIKRYLHKDKFTYPTGIVISPDITTWKTPFGFQMLLVVCFLPNEGKTFDHKRFLPEVYPVLSRQLYRP